MTKSGKFDEQSARRIGEAVRTVEGPGAIGGGSPTRFFRGGGKIAPGVSRFQVLTTYVTDAGGRSVYWDFPRAHGGDITSPPDSGVGPGGEPEAP